MIRNLLAILLALVGLSHSTANAQRPLRAVDRGDSGGLLMPAQAAYDVLFYDLAIPIDTDAESINGTLTANVVILSPLDVLVLDLDSALTVENVSVSVNDGDASNQQFEHRSGRLWIELGEKLPAGTSVSAAVTYGGAPRVAPNPPWIGGFTWSKTESGEPWVGVSCQMDGADIWWPSKDHPSDKPDSVALHFRVDTSLVAASNGRLLSVENHGDGTHTWHWFVSTPISNYAISLNLAPYEEITGTFTSITGEEVPFSFWVLPERLESGKRQYEQFRKELAFLEENLGPYPFRIDKYGVAHTPYLGMEHQTIIAYGSTFENNKYGFDRLHYHELAHEWWANLVTAADWKDFWIHEGFAVYMEALYAEELKGPDAYHDYMRDMRPRILNQKPVAPEEARSAQQMYFGDIYVKGAWILHTLRYLVGEQTIRLSLRRMAYPTVESESEKDGGQVRLVASQDFIDVVEDLSNEELGWFFNLYLRQSDLPELIVLRDGGRVDLTWKTPDNLPFPMPVDVRVGDQIRRVKMTEPSISIEVPEDAEVEVDPLGWILKTE